MKKKLSDVERYLIDSYISWVNKEHDFGKKSFFTIIGILAAFTAMILGLNSNEKTLTFSILIIILMFVLSELFTYADLRYHYNKIFEMIKEDKPIEKVSISPRTDLNRFFITMQIALLFYVILKVGGSPHPVLISVISSIISFAFMLSSERLKF